MRKVNNNKLGLLSSNIFREGQKEEEKERERAK